MKSRQVYVKKLRTHAVDQPKQIQQVINEVKAVTKVSESSKHNKESKDRNNKTQISKRKSTDLLRLIPACTAEEDEGDTKRYTSNGINICHRGLTVKEQTLVLPAGSCDSNN
jgi:hypothetical protein